MTCPVCAKPLNERLRCIGCDRQFESPGRAYPKVDAGRWIVAVKKPPEKKR